MASESKRILIELEGFSERQVATLVLDIVDNLIEDTPVDTGWAMANWVPSIGEAEEAIVGSRENINTGPQQLGMSKMATYNLNDGIIFITNNVPYILSLNDGSSSQAPALFIESAIENAINSRSRL